MTAIYTDGSYSSKESSVGYGVRIEHGDGYECFGGYFVNPQTDGNLHEHFAFVEGALLAKSLGLAPHQCTFITDLDNLVYGAQFAPGTAYRERLLTQLCAIRKYFRPSDWNAAFVYVTSQFMWQKGHAHCVNNRRADYLATLGRNKIAGRKVHLEEYDKWLHRPYFKRNHSGQEVAHYVPFTASIIERDGQTYALCV